MPRTPLLLVAGLLLVPADASAQPRPRATDGPLQPAVAIPADGTDLFRGWLDRAGITPVPRDQAWQLDDFTDVLVIVIGPPQGRNYEIEDPTWFTRRAVEEGGAVLIATDTPFPGQVPLAQRLWEHPDVGQRLLSLAVAPGPVECRAEGAALRDFPDCPFVVPLTRQVHPLAPDPDAPAGRVFEGLTRVATNQPGFLYTTGLIGQFRHPLAAYPRFSTAPDWRDVRGPLPANAFFAVGGSGPDPVNRTDYRFLAVADHSVFINQMLIEPGTQNLELTYRVIDFLSEPTFEGEGAQRRRVNKRSRCLFIENGRVIDRFDGLRQAFAPPRPPMPTPNLWGMQDKLVDLGNALIDEAQNRDVLNRLATRGFGVPAIVRFLLILLVIYSMWFLMKKMFSSRKPTDIPPPPNVAGVPTGPPGVFDRRQKELLRRNNVYEPVRDLVREFFASVGVHGEPGPKMPKVVIADTVRRPDSLRAALKDFWKLAYGSPQEVTVRRWQEMEPYFDRLRKAHADGKWRFVTGEPAA